MNTHRVRADGVRITHDPFAPGKIVFCSRFRAFLPSNLTIRQFKT